MTSGRREATRLRGGRVIVALLVVVLATACSRDQSLGPQVFRERSSLPSCGTFVAATIELTDEQHAMVDCILRAGAEGRPSELDYERSGTDCCRLRYVIRVLGVDNVEMFTASDNTNWVQSSCTGVGLTGEPFGYVEGKGCTARPL